MFLWCGVKTQRNELENSAVKPLYCVIYHKYLMAIALKEKEGFVLQFFEADEV